MRCPDTGGDDCIRRKSGQRIFKKFFFYFTGFFIEYGNVFLVK
jgi:hypothetical protein